MTEDYRAVTLGDAYNISNFIPLQDEDLEKYYYDLSEVRKTEAIDSINFILSVAEPETTKTILFAGHRGGGKTTELKRLEKKLQDKYFIIYFMADEELDTNDARYTDLYLVIIKQVEEHLRKKNITLDKRLLQGFEDWFKEITKENEETVERSVSIEAASQLGSQTPIPFLVKLWVKLLAQIKGSAKNKKIIRETLEKDISRLKADINALLRDGTKKLREKYPEYKGILIIVDNLDRVPPNVGEHLFFDYAAQLQELDCNIIYTVPISVVYSTENVGNTFDQNLHTLPMVNIYQYDSQETDLPHNDRHLKAMAEIIAKRVNTDILFESEQDLLEIAKASGGHVRQLMRIMRTACMTAGSRGHSKINNDDVDYAIKQEQFSFERVIPHQHYEILAKVCQSKNLENNETSQAILYNTSVLEYNGINRWNYVNPVIKRSELFQEALKSL
ncbi:MAG: AAA family ATPase [Okeania sp. SIO3B5]|uniref:P-loop NTPase fold protein n=1 Tax=Okeania sp. SIO3B5 TaxID=2607811 RepID=UPI0013FF590B|nr:P-loop NTPase fold protein [Okeania sp. SIO3B5]NEO58000.1 AAA family ATPase [Okeania sp. SIO3B5]